MDKYLLQGAETTPGFAGNTINEVVYSRQKQLKPVFRSLHLSCAHGGYIIHADYDLYRESNKPHVVMGVYSTSSKISQLLLENENNENHNKALRAAWEEEDRVMAEVDKDAVRETVSFAPEPASTVDPDDEIPF